MVGCTAIAMALGLRAVAARKAVAPLRNSHELAVFDRDLAAPTVPVVHASGRVYGTFLVRPHNQLGPLKVGNWEIELFLHAHQPINFADRVLDALFGGVPGALAYFLARAKVACFDLLEFIVRIVFLFAIFPLGTDTAGECVSKRRNT